MVNPEFSAGQVMGFGFRKAEDPIAIELCPHTNVTTQTYDHGFMFVQYPELTDGIAAEAIPIGKVLVNRSASPEGIGSSWVNAYVNGSFGPNFIAHSITMSNRTKRGIPNPLYEQGIKVAHLWAARRIWQAIQELNFEYAGKSPAVSPSEVSVNNRWL